MKIFLQPPPAIIPAVVEVPVVPPRPSLPSVPKETAGPSTTPAQRPTLQKQNTLTRLSGNHSSTTAMMKNVTVIQERQQEYRKAAVEAKKNGDLDQARAYLKIFKALEQLLDVAKGGMPVDMSTVRLLSSLRKNSTIYCSLSFAATNFTVTTSNSWGFIYNR